jgi:excisionase family DNA binding protein
MTARPLDGGPSAPNSEHTSFTLAVPVDFVEQVAHRAAELLAEREDELRRPWLDVAGAAAHLACPPSRVYALVSARRIPHERDGSRLLFRPEALDDWVRRGGGTRP